MKIQFSFERNTTKLGKTIEGKKWNHHFPLNFSSSANEAVSMSQQLCAELKPKPEFSLSFSCCNHSSMKCIQHCHRIRKRQRSKWFKNCFVTLADNPMFYSLIDKKITFFLTCSTLGQLNQYLKGPQDQ